MNNWDNTVSNWIDHQATKSFRISPRKYMKFTERKVHYHAARQGRRWKR